MKKIDKGHDVLEWARMIVDAKGEKFTALSKTEQLVIARFIVESQSTPAPENEQVGEPQGDSYIQIGCDCDAQQAFDKFLSWCKDHPKEKEVMDFSTGEKSVAAAFAFWLCGQRKALNVN